MQGTRPDGCRAAGAKKSAQLQREGAALRQDAAEGHILRNTVVQIAHIAVPSLRSIVSFSGFAVAAQISRFLPSVRLGSLLISLVVCFRHLFSLREHETENAAFTIQSLSAKIRKKQKKEYKVRLN